MSILTQAAVTVIKNRRNRRNTPSSRGGYVDERGQVFLPPVSSKALAGWKLKMRRLGHKFEE